MCALERVSFAHKLTESAFALRDALDSGDARVLAREFLTMSQAEFSARFKDSAMKRAKRRALALYAAVVLGNVGTSDDVPLLEVALQHDEHVPWVLRRIRASSNT